MQLLVLFSYVFLGIRWVVTFANYLTFPVLKKQKSPESPLVSILIPARNEENNIKNALNAIVSQSYTNLEIIVLDDHSTDQTASIIQSFSTKNPLIRCVSGQPLPQGWLGKNWACHQLAFEAKGEYLLFLDADIEIKDGLIESMLLEATKDKLALFSIFPFQKMYTWGEKTVVPLMFHLLLTLLPLRLILKAKAPSLAAANGQCMLFNAEVYKRHFFHEKAKNVVVEDIRIMQIIKSLGLKGNTVTDLGMVQCRMYTGYWEGCHGFTKNLLAGFGGSIVGLLFFLVFTVVVFCLPITWTLFPWSPYVLVFAIVSMKAMVARLTGQSFPEQILLHPFQMATMVGIGINSIIKTKSGNQQWKGRNVSLS